MKKIELYSMQKLERSVLETNFLVNNVVSTATLNQKVDINRLADYPWGIYDPAFYGGRCGYIRTPDMSGCVAIFANGKMISVGAKTVEEAEIQFHNAKFLLLREGLIKETPITQKIQNIMATLSLGTTLNLKKITRELKNARYNSEQFAGVIVKQKGHPTFLIFSTGKIVIAGSKSIKQLQHATNFIKNELKVIKN